ncbi:hypothetical protein [Arthrobacter sp. M4]|uniref:hypothetical protein n=1 Tax=Arthrobacter sp. M4 TaxID=218160 RepID=UPI001CDCD55C|nr:hypothetical protein [Arthrobacter sp. M4]MCA4133788.1 hypothetical protein [Arthrobacter sp. M4]
MFTALLGRVVAWIETAYFHDIVEESSQGILEATRWGWLPALSGVAIARDTVAARPDGRD